MGKVIASITQSLDGCIVGPDDGPELGLGRGGERLHYWVMGGPWTYDDDGHDTDGMSGADREYYDSSWPTSPRASSAAACTTRRGRGAARTRSPAR